MNGASVVRLVLIITLLYLNAYLATLNITLASGLHKTMSHHAPGFQQQQVQVQVPRLRPPATDQVLGVGTAWEPQPVWCYQQDNQCNIAKAMMIVF